MQRPILHLICQSHLDPVWLWPTRDGAAAALATIQSAVDRAAEFPTFRYTRSSAAAYRWVEQMDPPLFQRVFQLVAEGRWEVVGGWVEQPDCNLPSAESFVRQAVVGQSYFRSRFGEAGVSRVAYVPDSFGHAGGLPQILRRCGYDAYAFMRPMPVDRPELPRLFHWESPDTSRVLGIHIVNGYSQSYSSTADDIEATIRAAAVKSFAPGFNVGVMWLGVGNHGGMLTREHILRVIQLQKDSSLPELRFSSVADFVSVVRQDSAYAALPTWKGEIGYPFRGCYSATGETKADNRAAEKGLFSAEAMSVIAGPPYTPASRLSDAWWKLLFNQFHDILAGTCTHNTQAESRRRFGAVLDDARDERLRLSGSIARSVDTRGESAVVCCANPLPWARRALVEFDTFIEPHGCERIIHLESRDGQTRYPIQWQTPDANFGPWGMKWGKLTALVDLPPAGYRVLRIVTEPIERRTEEPVTTPDTTNPQFTVASNQPNHKDEPRSITDQSALTSLQTPHGTELLREPVGFVVIDDPNDTWGMGIDSYASVCGEPEVFETETLESGPLIKVIRQKSRWGRSLIWMDVVRMEGDPGVELRLRALWLENRKILKLRVPTLVIHSNVSARMPAEIALRPADGKEYACHGWIAIQGDVGHTSAGVSLANDSSYSYSAENGELRMIVARAVPHAEHPPFNYPDTRNLAMLDHGWHERRFRLLPNDGVRTTAHIERDAQEFQIPIEVFPDSGHPGARDWEDSVLTITPASIAIHALTTDPDASVSQLRIQELSGEATQATITFQGEVVIEPLKPWEMTTLKLSRTTTGIICRRLDRV